MKLTDLYQIYLSCNSVCTDTRKIKPNDIYFALKGQNFDGNLFAEKALKMGASYAVVDKENIANKDEKIILVNDTLTTLQNLANYHRQQTKLRIIGLTGSNGKTTTKELILNILSTTYKVKATKGNLNNHIGVPLTLLSFSKDLDFGIVEMGANHQKEIEFLSQIAEPDYGLITNFGKAHLEGFGGIEGVIKGKSELYEDLKSRGKMVFINTSDPKQLQQIENYKHIFTYGELSNSDCRIKLKEASPFVKISYNELIIKSQLIGHYNFANIASAIAISHYFKVSPTFIKYGIENYQPDNNRSQIIHKGTTKIILDAYNANPTSMMAALEHFKQFNAKIKYLFLGDMFELGEDASKEHQNIAEVAINYFEINIHLIGANFYKTNTPAKVEKFRNFEDLIPALNNLDLEGAVILIKGSRGMALERLLDYI